jgi:hypothetical protein
MGNRDGGSNETKTESNAVTVNDNACNVKESAEK